MHLRNSWSRGCTQKLFFFTVSRNPIWNGRTDTATVGPVALGPCEGMFQSLLTAEAAVTEAVVGQPAVVGPNGVEIQVAVFNATVQNYETQQGHKRSNEALKYLRAYVGESETEGVPSV